MKAWIALLAAGCSEYEFGTVKDVAEPEEEEETGSTPEDTSPPADTAPPQDTGTGEEVVEGEPVADAGADQEIAPLDTIQLDGSGSYDPAGLEPLTFRWTLQSRPSGSTTAITGATDARPRMFADLAGDYSARLEVWNSAGVDDSTPDEVIFHAKPSDSFYVQLSWNTTPTDLDLHLIEGSHDLFDSPYDCDYCNMAPNWGSSGSGDDPSLDYDTIDGYGPETTTITTPAAGTYRVLVHYYGESGSASCWGACPTSTATVGIYVNGTLEAEYVRDLYDQGAVWEVAEIDWPSATITENGTQSSTSLISCF